METNNQDDFRSLRKKLPPNAFASGPEEPDASPSDPIDKKTWNNITSLPNDVSIRTTDNYGSILKRFWSLWSEWICLVGSLQQSVEDPSSSPAAHVASISIDEIQASIYNVLVGFYRLGFSSLRNVLEQMTIGMHLELANDKRTFSDWLKGNRELNFGWAADNVHKHSSISSLEHHLIDDLGESLFRQKKQKFGPGFARRLFNILSNFTHGGPEFTNADMWQGSNGPIFVSKAFEKWVGVFAEIYALGVLEAKLAQPKIDRLAFSSSFSVHDLFKQAAILIPLKEDGSPIMLKVIDLKDLW